MLAFGQVCTLTTKKGGNRKMGKIILLAAILVAVAGAFLLSHWATYSPYNQTKPLTAKKALSQVIKKEKPKEKPVPTAQAKKPEQDSGLLSGYKETKDDKGVKQKKQQVIIFKGDTPGGASLSVTLNQENQGGKR